MPRASRASLVLLMIVLAGVGAASIGLRVVAQQTSPPQEAPARSAPEAADEGDSAQAIEDDPIVAPDAESSADNNLTFPVDI